MCVCVSSSSSSSSEHMHVRVLCVGVFASVLEPYPDKRVFLLLRPPLPSSPGRRRAIRENYQQFRVWRFWPQGCPLSVCMPLYASVCLSYVSVWMWSVSICVCCAFVACHFVSWGRVMSWGRVPLCVSLSVSVSVPVSVSVSDIQVCTVTNMVGPMFFIL